MAYRERLLALRKDPRLEYVLIFKNHGVAAGASLEHPHSQLIATPILPELVAEELEGAVRYFRMKERCVWCDIVRQERRDGSRLVLEEDGFVAVAPFAPRFPYETWSCRPPTGRASRACYRTRWTPWRVCSASWSAGWRGCSATRRTTSRSTPRRSGRRIPSTSTGTSSSCRSSRGVAGFELGTGFFINPTPPEDAARFLRQAGRSPERAPA